MYDLASRFNDNNQIGATPPNLGPNNYTLCYKFNNLKNRAPFLHTAKRKGAPALPVYTEQIYKPRIESNVTGGTSVRYTEIRMKDEKDPTPGPGTYDPKLVKKGKCSCPPPEKHGKGRLYVCRVPYSIWDSAPSVPTHIDANGYDIDEKGDIVKVPLEDIDQTRGPAYYNVPSGEVCYTTRYYHTGNRWSLSKTKRDGPKPEKRPGPAEYDVSLKFCRYDEEEEEYRELSRLLTFAPRYTEAQMLRIAKENMPGPAQYYVKSTGKCCANCLSVTPVPLVSGAKRFRESTSKMPAPNEYDISQCVTGKKRFLTKEVPFLCSGERFPERKASDSPSPGAYNVKGAIEEKLRRKIPTNRLVDVPFLRTSERQLGPDTKEAANSPGPGEYDVADTTVEEQCIFSYVFRRKGTHSRKRHDEDEGGLYDISEDAKRLYNPTSHNKGKIAFMTTQKRGIKCSTDTPSPADYLGLDDKERTGRKFSRVDRFKYSYNENPGPGSYDVHPSHALSLYRAMSTHNIRLKENLKRTKLRLPPAATWEKWVAEKNKKKQLRWFSRPTVEYVHCPALQD